VKYGSRNDNKHIWNI